MLVAGAADVCSEQSYILPVVPVDSADSYCALPRLWTGREEEVARATADNHHGEQPAVVSHCYQHQHVRKCQLHHEQERVDDLDLQRNFPVEIKGIQPRRAHESIKECQEISCTTMRHST